MSQNRRSAGRRRAWGRGPIILQYDSLEKREVLSAAAQGLPDLVGSSFVTVQNADWGDSVTASGQITNQGAGDVTKPFNVAIYASGRAAIGRASVYLGEVTIPGGLAAGQSVPFTTTVQLPSSPVPNMAQNGIVHLDIKVDSQQQVAESNERNNSGVGPGYDESAIQISPAQPALLKTASVGVYPTSATWGRTLSVTAQIANASYGAAPATRAQVVLTPVGILQGSGSDVTIGSIKVPAVAAWQTANIEANIQLPAIPPLLLSGTTQYTLSVLPDADFLTNPVSPHLATGGIGVDQAVVTVNLPVNADGTTTTPDYGVLPDLATGTVTVGSSELNWGKSFQVQTTVQNMGEADPGPFRVRFLLVGPSGNTTRSIFLGDATIPGLAPGYSQPINQTLTLPSRLPDGVVLDSVGIGKIVVVADPENALNETFKNNNTATSAPITLRLLGSNGSTYVPNYPPPGQLLPVNLPSAAKNRRAATAAQAAKGLVAPPTKKLYRRPLPKINNSVTHQLSVFPKTVGDFIKKYI
ncbi:MAG: CARDB domain-containing protein [Paludisphaera borealis]|uniref:CARDB domain-containing protein n=1 Tax=Paludisphaera borealis TaxID=1387353 RepID=UPI0028459328|nr:CARDB domain-containing protein [Paludisphaera borealis]MDR3617802.1 CARDB domain-containing protein [Paludisphaera borealis]